MRRGGVVLAGALGLGAGRAAALPGAAPSVASGVTATTLSLRGRAWRLSSQTRRTGQLLTPGDRLVASGELADARGDVVGSFHGMYVAVASPGQVGTGALTSLQQHTFVLADGTITGSGVGSHDVDLADEYAIVGGTGRYLGARGSYMAVQRFVELGGDGTATITMTLLAEGAGHG